jgi:predicted glycogen debranching enzyme
MMRTMPHREAWRKEAAETPRPLVEREWLITNGLGGYASGTLAGVCTRRYHGLLVAALPAPQGRVMMLNHLAEDLRLSGGRRVHLGGDELAEGVLEAPGVEALAAFRLELGLPVWVFDLGGGAVLEKRVVMPRGRNTVHVRYRLLEGDAPVRLRLRPSVHFRSHSGPVGVALEKPYRVTATGDQYEVEGPDGLTLRLRAEGESSSFVLDGGRFREIFYRVESRHGYDSRGCLWSPGYLRAEIARDRDVSLVASAEASAALGTDEVLEAETRRRRGLIQTADPAARTGLGAELALAADAFLIVPMTRQADRERARAVGEDAETVIAGYHWFTDWGRDTMISLEGLALLTGRRREAGAILRTFGQHVRDGLIPNQFPEGREEGVYNTADATLWYFHAIEVYARATGDRETVRNLLPRLRAIVEAHVRGTRYGIATDPADGLLRQGAEGYALTWMDAKMGDWVVTPRRGKAVEINALWYQALRLMAAWTADEEGDPAARPYAERAEQVRESFNRRFWQGRHLYDVVDGPRGDDPSLRPNQIFAVSLPHPVLDPARWKPVVDAVEEELLTPVGLRSLAAGDVEYKPRYDGDLRTRDGAYHQGTVWGWLIGPFIDAWIRTHPQGRREARRFLEGFAPHLSEAGVGSVSEIFDAEAPYTARGCVAQAWSVAEVLRAWIKTGDPEPGSRG